MLCTLTSWDYFLNIRSCAIIYLSKFITGYALLRVIHFIQFEILFWKP